MKERRIYVYIYIMKKERKKGYERNGFVV